MILLASFILWLVLVLIIYNHVGWREIKRLLLHVVAQRLLEKKI